MLSASILVLLLVVTGTRQVRGDCEHEGVTYKLGEVMTSLYADDPCTTCACGERGPSCVAVMCAPLQCVDPDFEGSNACCGACINGMYYMKQTK